MSGGGEASLLQAVEGETRFARWRRLCVGTMPFACLYASFGATFSLLGTGAPLAFRAKGMPLEQIGWLQIIYLPIGVTFLWAPLVDRLTLPRLPHRIGWILTAQVATVVLLLAMSFGTTWSLAALFLMALATSIAMATMDVAVEALVVETVPREHRPPITTAKLVGSSFGTAAGIVLVTTMPKLIDLPRAAIAVAAFDALALLPMLRYPEAARRFAGAGRGIALRPAADRFRKVGAHGAVIGLYFAFAIMIGSTPSLSLLDLGIALPTVGLLTGPATTAINAITMVLSGALLMRIASHRLVLAGAAGVASAGLLFAGAASGHVGSLAVVAALLITLFEAGLSIPVFNVMYRWAEGGHAATDYAVLFGIAFLVSFPARVAAPMLAASLGWPLFFALTAPAYAAAAFLLARAMQRTPDSA